MRKTCVISYHIWIHMISWGYFLDCVQFLVIHINSLYILSLQQISIVADSCRWFTVTLGSVSRQAVSVGELPKNVWWQGHPRNTRECVDPAVPGPMCATQTKVVPCFPQVCWSILTIHGIYTKTIINVFIIYRGSKTYTVFSLHVVVGGQKVLCMMQKATQNGWRLGWFIIVFTTLLQPFKIITVNNHIP